ncbi:hypothetical protein IX51_07230 [uncultured archaeon]|nr:hypothetical protein IX51_07230 [uncultured archaeon]
MPTIEITARQMDDEQKRNIAKGFAKVLIDNGVPEKSITILFRHISDKDIAKGSGAFPYWEE